ncbi:MAG: hypothetical protein ACLTDD_08415 [Thomasclavelia spiroformis]|uniref:hypothetical protein n=1 Tax=Thomasclavelia spiroformis TaxID=29348 RepID=UPI0039932952
MELDNLNKIKTLLDIFFNEFNSLESTSPDDTILLFKNIFNDDITKQVITENEPYYKLNTNNYYLNGGYGIGLAEITGQGDIGFSSTSHHSTDIYIFSELANIRIPLFIEGKRIDDISLSNKLCNFDLSLDSLSHISDFAFKFIPDEIKNNEEIVKFRYNRLISEAKDKHNNDVENSSISNYDFDVYPEEYYLYNSILEHKDDIYFMQKVIKMFIEEYHDGFFLDYIDNRILDCQYALYMIEHKDKYYDIANCHEKIFNAQNELNLIQEEITNCEEEITNLNIKYKNCLEKINELNENKHSIFNFFKKNSINEEILELQSDLNLLEIDIEASNRKSNTLNNLYKEKEEEIAVYTKKETYISSKLEKDYKNFTINFDSDDLPYIDRKYYQKVNIDRLVKKKDDYENMLNELFEIKKYQIDNSIALDNIEINYSNQISNSDIETEIEDSLQL